MNAATNLRRGSVIDSAEPTLGSAAGVARYRASKTYPSSDATDTVPFRVTTTSTQ